jgi:hypothetical protein
MICTERKPIIPLAILVAALLFLLTTPIHYVSGNAWAQPAQTFDPLPAPGKKVPLKDGYYMIYGFDKKPKLGTTIMKVEIFTADGKKDTSFEVKAEAGMPTMKGAHETGDKVFSISKKGGYLLPIPIVMPGEWEVRLTIAKDGKTVLRGRYNFDV